MRKVFLDDLPKKQGIGANYNKMTIDWANSVGYMIKFQYDDINGAFKIMMYNPQKQTVHILYNTQEYVMRTGELKKCCISHILGKFNTKHLYNTNDVVSNIKNGRLLILKQIRLNSNRKGYEYECLVCGNQDTISETNLIQKSGCNVCSNNKVKRYYNDLWTTHPEIAQLLKCSDRGYSITYGSDQQEIFICPDCGYETNKRIADVVRQGLSCPRCGDGISYPEKFIFNVLQQLNVKIIYQASKKYFIWCQEYKYDFYIPSLHCIIETHGAQHYLESTFARKKYRTLAQEHVNDTLKKTLALSNGIKYYVEVNCRKSDFEWIKSNVIDALHGLMDLSHIDWLKCHQYACSSIVKKACDLWELGSNTNDISTQLFISRCTVIRYLKKGALCGLCSYDAKLSIKNNAIIIGRQNKKRVYCLNTNEVFQSMTEASVKYKINNITACCKGIQKSAGKHPETGEKLRWMYYEDYIKQNEKVLLDKT